MNRIGLFLFSIIPLGVLSLSGCHQRNTTPHSRVVYTSTAPPAQICTHIGFKKANRGSAEGNVWTHPSLQQEVGYQRLMEMAHEEGGNYIWLTADSEVLNPKHLFQPISGSVYVCPRD